jgi:FkbM family methyltransferase
MSEEGAGLYSTYTGWVVRQLSSPGMKRLISNAVHSVIGQFGYDLARRSSYSLGDPGSVAALARHLEELFPALGIDTVIDVGANKGQYYHFLRERVRFRGRIVSFEPIPELAQDLQGRSRSDKKWSVHNIALGREHGTLPFNVSENSGWSSLRDKVAEDTTDVASKVSFGRKIDVEVRTLGEVFEAIEPGLNPGGCYLKLDSQGFDLEIMLGGAGILPHIPALQTELEMLKVYAGAPDYLHVIDHLRKQRFELTAIFPIWSDRTFRVGEMDAVFRNMQLAST